MPQRQSSNSKLPGSSSSLSLNESPPSEDINYDSDISDDDNAIAEDEDGDENEEDGDAGDEVEEEFQVEISTLTGNTFNVTIHPSDTLEVLKTRIAFQEGISPADQNLLLEKGKLLEPSRGNDTIEELSIDRHSKLTLVTNISSGTGAEKRTHLRGGDNHSFGPASFHNLAPTIKRNYHNHNFTTHPNGHAPHQPSSNSSTGSLRLPKILHETNSDNKGDSAMHIIHNSSNPYIPTVQRLDERIYMESLFNKIVQDDENAEEVIDMDSTRTTATTASLHTQEAITRQTRYGKNQKITHRPEEEDGSILIVQGDDGVILIIQKNTGEPLEDSFRRNNLKDNSRNSGAKTNGAGFDLEFCSGRISATIGSASTRNRKYQSSQVHEKIKENAITLEKMKHVRGMLAQKQHKREESLPPRPPAPLNRLEFPRILERAGTTTTANSLSSNSANRNWQRDSFGSNEHVPGIHSYGGKKIGMGGSALGQNLNNGAMRTRSLNSSKMSLNRLVAEIYLQSKRKGHAFQPGQPPYTEQQLVRYVQLRVAILLEEQTKNKTEPCTKCQKHGEWLQDKTPPYLVPTVVMDRFKRLGNGKKWKSMEHEEDQGDDVRPLEFTLRRKSLIPVTSSSSLSSYKSLIGEIHIPGVGATTDSNNLTSSRVKPFGVINTTSKPGARKPSSTNHFSIGNNSNNLARTPSLKIHQKMYTSTSSTSTGNRVTYAVGGMRKVQSRPGSSTKSSAPKKGSAVRCQVCKKKIGIACRYQCRCGLTFCSIHRYPETHSCTVDYKEEGRNKISQDNPVIVAPKIQKI